MAQKARLCPSDMAAVILLPSLRLEKGECYAFRVRRCRLPLMTVLSISLANSLLSHLFRAVPDAIFDDATSPQTAYQDATQTGVTERSATTTPTTPYSFVYFYGRPIPPNIAASPISSIGSRSLSSLLTHYEQNPRYPVNHSPAIPVPHLLPHRVREHAPISKATSSVATRLQLTHQTAEGLVYEHARYPPTSPSTHSRTRSNARYERNFQYPHPSPHHEHLALVRCVERRRPNIRVARSRSGGRSACHPHTTRLVKHAQRHQVGC